MRRGGVGGTVKAGVIEIQGDYRDLLHRRLGPVHPALEPGRIVRRDGEVYTHKIPIHANHAKNQLNSIPYGDTVLF